MEQKKPKPRSGKRHIRFEDWNTDIGITKIEAWARDGLTHEQIAVKIGVALSAFKTWRKKSPMLEAALKNSKEVADIAVENSLYNRALGFSKTIKKPMKVKNIIYDPETGKRIEEKEKIVFVEEEIYIQPETVAMIFWLKNRKPSVWRDRPANSTNTENEQLVKNTIEELKEKVIKRFGDK